jgi:hypothetical protein
MFEESIALGCDPIWEAVGICVAAVNAAAAAVAVADGAAGVDVPAAGTRLEASVPEPEMRLCVSNALSAGALLWPAAIVLPLDEDVPLAGAAGAPATGGGEGITFRAPASACSKSASAFGAGSVADCFGAGGLELSESDASA